MSNYRRTAVLVPLAASLLVIVLAALPALASKRDVRPKGQPDNPAGKDSTVDGIVLTAFWTAAKQKGQET